MRIGLMGGYGEIGRVTAIDLSESCKNCEIIIIGRDGKKAKELIRLLKNKNVFFKKADILKKKETVNAIKDCDVVINAAQYYFNLEVMNACLTAKTNYLDLGGLFHFTKKQLKLHNKFKKKNLLAVLGCGSTPGITNVMAAYGAGDFDRINSIHVSFADKDYTKYNMPFVVPYSMQTVFDEFTMRPAVFENGKMKFVKPVSGTIKIPFPKPVNSAGCFYTLHSEVATFPLSFRENGIRNCSFRGGFDPDFVGKVKFLIDAGLASTKKIKIGKKEIAPRGFIVKELSQFIPGKNVKINDVEFLRVEISGKKNGKNKKIVIYCKSVSNKKWNIPAGSLNTGTAPSIIAQMIARKEIKKTGVVPPEKCVPAKKFFKELEKRNIKVFTAKK